MVRSRPARRDVVVSFLVLTYRYVGWMVSAIGADIDTNARTVATLTHPHGSDVN